MMYNSTAYRCMLSSCWARLKVSLKQRAMLDPTRGKLKNFLSAELAKLLAANSTTPTSQAQINLKPLRCFVLLPRTFPPLADLS